jgi:hypothetical protein
MRLSMCNCWGLTGDELLSQDLVCKRIERESRKTRRLVESAIGNAKGFPTRKHHEFSYELQHSTFAKVRKYFVMCDDVLLHKVT